MVFVVGAGRRVRLGTRGANEISPVCGGHAMDVTPRMLLSPLLTQFALGYLSQYGL